MPDISMRTRRTQFRADPPADGQPMVVEGYFVVFDQPYYIDEIYEEYVDRHAFDDADMSDVRALIDHNSWQVLGRRNQDVQTLSFDIDDVGVYARIQINPDDTDAMSLRARVLRGDVDQASFGFTERSVEYVDLPDGRCRRIIPAQIVTSGNSRSAHSPPTSKHPFPPAPAQVTICAGSCWNTANKN